MQKKIIVAMTTMLVGASLSVNSVAQAASKPYKVVKNKLVHQKTGKLIKGYVVFKGKLYKNGKLNKGYAKIGTGNSMKLYYNANLKKGYKKANGKTLLFHNGILAKGPVQTKDKKTLYVNGKLAKGTFVYENLDGNVFLYENGQLSKGLKTAAYETITCLFNDGVFADGTRVHEGKLYENGKPNVGLKYIGGVFYFGTDLANAEIDGVRYEQGRVTATAEQLQVEKSQQDVEAAETVVYETKTDYIEFNKITNKVSGNTAPTIKPSALKKKNVLTLAQFIEKYKDQELTDSDKAEIESLRATYEAEATQNLQAALQHYESALKDFATAVEVAAKAGDSTNELAVWQEALASKAKTVTALQTEVATFKNIQFDVATIIDAFNAAVSATGGDPLPPAEQPSEPVEQKPTVPTPTPSVPNTPLPNDNNSKPSTPEQGEGNGTTPEQGEENGTTPEQSEENGTAPEQSEENGTAPEQGEGNETTPEQGEEAEKTILIEQITQLLTPLQGTAFTQADIEQALQQLKVPYTFEVSVVDVLLTKNITITATATEKNEVITVTYTVISI